MKKLIIDGSFDTLNLSIFDAKEIIYDLHLNSPYTHSKILTDVFSYAFNLLSFNLEDIDMLYCCIGPGKYTSLRVTLATIKGMFFKKIKYIYGFSSLDMMATEEKNNEPFRIICEISKTKTYFADYICKDGFIQRVENIKSSTMEQAINTNHKIIKRNSIESVRNIFQINPKQTKKLSLHELAPVY